MLSTPSINQLSTTRPDLYAFRVSGTVTRDDMTEMAQHMNAAFDAHEKVDMLLAFDNFEGSTSGSGMSLETLKSQTRALSSVRRYVVANAPEDAEEMIAFFDKLLPVQAETFPSINDAFDALDASSMTDL